MTLDEMILQHGGRIELLEKIQSGEPMTDEEEGLFFRCRKQLGRYYAGKILHDTKRMTADEYMILMSAFTAVVRLWKDRMEDDYFDFGEAVYQDMESEADLIYIQAIQAEKFSFYVDSVEVISNDAE